MELERRPLNLGARKLSSEKVGKLAGRLTHIVHRYRLQLGLSKALQLLVDNNLARGA